MPTIKFTNAAIESAPIPDKDRTDYQFAEIPGLVLRVSSFGKRTFYVLARIKGGKLIRQKIGDWPQVKRELAKEKASALIASLAVGDDPTEARREIRKALTLADAFEQFLTGKRKKDGTPLASSSIKNYRDAMNHCSAIAQKKLPAITHDDIDRVYKQVGAKYPTTANRTRAMLSSLFSWCVEHRLVDANPVTGIKKAYAENERERFLSGDELRRFFESMNIINPDLRDFFLMSLLTGARRANVMAMAWAEIDMGAAEWRIAKTKNGSSHTVTLGPEAIAILQQRKESSKSPFVFPGHGKTGHIVEPKRSWAALMENAGIENLRLHDLRRTLGSWQAKTGASLAIIGKSLNHKSIQATRIYARLDMDPVRASVQTATDAMLVAAGVKKAADVVPMKRKK